MAFAESTYRTRQSQWNKYYEFCNIYNYTAIPASESQMCNYITYMTQSLCFTSLINYLSAVWLLHKLLGYESCQKSFLVSQTVKGARRVLGSHIKQAKLLLPQDLKCLFHKIDITDTLYLCFWCAILTCFRALLRKAHVTKSSMSLLKNAFSFHRWGVMVRVDHTKTIQHRERCLFIPIHAHKESIFDLKHYLLLLFKKVGTNNGDEAFTYLHCGKKKVLSYSLFQSLLKNLTKSMGIENISSHSLRRSGASFLFSIGQSLVNIKQRGDWKSLSVLLYLT